MNPTDEKDREDSLNPGQQQYGRMVGDAYTGKKDAAEAKYGRYASAPGVENLAKRERSPEAPRGQSILPGGGNMGGGAGAGGAGGGFWSGGKGGAMAAKDKKEGEEEEQNALNSLAAMMKRRKKSFIALALAAFIAVTGMSVFNMFPNLQTKVLANAIEHLTSKLVRVAIQKRLQRYLDSYLERVALQDVKACGDSRNIECMKGRQSSSWPKGKIGKMMQAWDKDKLLIQMFNLNGNYITYDGGTFKMNTRKGVYEIPEGDVGGGKLRLTKYMKKDFSAASALFRDLEISAFFDFSISRLIARNVVEWSGLPMCNYGCDQEKLKEFKDLPDKDKEKDIVEAEKGLLRHRIINPLKHTGALTIRCLLRLAKCEEEASLDEELEKTRTDIKNEHRTTKRDFTDLKDEGKKLTPDIIGKSGMFREGIQKLTSRILTTSGTLSIPGINFIVLLAKIADTVFAIIKMITGEWGSVLTIIQGQQGNRSIQMLANFIRTMQALGAAQWMTTGGAENSALKNLNDASIAKTYSKRLEGFQTSELFLRLYGTLNNKKKDEVPFSEVCRDGKVIEKDSPRPVCRNFDLARMPGIVEWFQDHTVIAAILNAVVDAVNTIAGLQALLKALELIDNIIAIIFEAIPLIQQIAELLMKILGFEKLLEWAITFLTPVVSEALGPLFAYQEEVRGPGLFNASMMGRDLSNYKYARDKMGGKDMTDEEAQAQLKAAYQEEGMDRQYASLNQRLFSFEDSTSLVSQLVLNGPFTDVTSPQKLLAAINPFNLFSSILSLPRAHAYASDYDLPSARFGTPNSSVPIDHEAIERDPWDNAVDECEDSREPQTYQVINSILGPVERKIRNSIGDPLMTEVEPCMIDEEVPLIGQAAFTEDVLLPGNYASDTEEESEETENTEENQDQNQDQNQDDAGPTDVD